MVLLAVAFVAWPERAVAKTPTLAQRVRALEMPMPVGARLAAAPEGAPAYAQADQAAGVVYAQGPLDKFTAAHETAHLLKLTEADRRRFARVMGRPNGQWWVGEPGGPGYRGSLGERFADMAAIIATDVNPRKRWSGTGYIDRPPSLRRLLRFGQALERYGRRNGLGTYSGLR
jgi:hypothetical protein